jgi:ribosomal protein L11 methyltransferase
MPSYSLTFSISPDQKDLIIADAFAFGMSGCTEETAAEGEKLICYFDSTVSLGAARTALLDRFPSVQTAIAEIPDTDWNAQWKASMQPALVAPGIWVSPTWLAPSMAATDHWIKIEPKTAFGTGHHATTRLAAKALWSLRGVLSSGFSMLDIGTGTGVLCFTAELFGARLTIGTDIDPVCAENLSENRRNNPTAGAGGFAIGGLDMFKLRPSFDCIVMNMLQVESQPLLDRVFLLLKTNGHLVWSGILIEEKNNIIFYASQKGFVLREETTEEEWWCGWFIKE